MPTPTYDLIASNVLGSSAASVTFSSIPATYRDLVLVARYLSTAAGGSQGRIRFNSDTGNNYNYVAMDGNGTSASSFASSNQAQILATNSDNNNAGLFILNLMDYSATDKHKTGLLRINKHDENVAAYATRWANTAAINAIEIYTTSNQFATGSSFYLYGIVS